MRTSAATRPLTLRAPIASEEERAHFQQRLTLTALVVFILSFGFLFAMVVAIAIVEPSHLWIMLAHRSTAIHIATATISFLVWVAIRGPARSARLLGVLDIVISVGPCIGWSAMAVSGIPASQRPDMIAVLASIFTLVMRGALIPSTPARTAVLGAVSFAALAVMVSTLPPVTTAGEPGLPPTTGVILWGLLAVAATTVISQVTYGLRLQVRKAMQLGQYVLEERIGEGGMGVVYRASHAMLRRPTAIKLLSGTAEHAAQRFEREVQITARLTHPNTVAVFDYGRTPAGIFYYAMEFLDGVSLEDLVRDDGPQPPRRVVHLLLQMCGALKEAHDAGLVHRDIKPANVMLTVRGGVPDVVKVLDFGLVKETGSANAPIDPAATEVTTIMGTPHYMAPEAIVDPLSIDGRADLYAVGATAYFLLTAEHVFGGNSLVEVCSKHLHEPPEAPSKKNGDVPAGLDRVVLACLAKKAADRPKDAAALAALLRACEVGEWTEEEALRWWARRKPSTSVSPVKTKVSAFGATIAVALEDRQRD